MPAQAPGDRRTYVADDGVGFESRGYLCAPGVGDRAKGHDRVKKADAGEGFAGVTYKSTLDLEDEELYTGTDALVAVQQEGTVPVLCETGNNYEFGDDLHVSGTVSGVATNVTDGTEGMKVGAVNRSRDLTEADGDYQLVLASIHTNIGGE